MAVLNEEQEMLRDMARDWAVNESPVTEFRKVRASGEPEAFNRDAYATMAQMGWAGVIIPEEHGGSDFGFLSAGLVVEELGKTLTASPLVMNTVAASAIVLGGSDEQKAQSLEYLARANLADNRMVAAESTLQQAQALSWSQERARLLSEIAPKEVSSAVRKPLTRRPTVEEPSKIPKAYRAVESEYPQAPVKAPTLGQPVVIPRYNPRTLPAPPTEPPAPEQPIQYQPPANSPASYQSNSPEKEHLGDDGVLETYRSSRPKTGSGVPGYR